MKAVLEAWRVEDLAGSVVIHAQPLFAHCLVQRAILVISESMIFDTLHSLPLLYPMQISQLTTDIRIWRAGSGYCKECCFCVIANTIRVSHLGVVMTRTES